MSEHTYKAPKVPQDVKIMDEATYRKGHYLDKQLPISVDRLCTHSVSKNAAMKLLSISTTRNDLNKGPIRWSATCVTNGSTTFP